MNVFSGLQVYNESWQVIDNRPFSPEECAAVSKAEVVASQYGNSVCFFMNGGGQTYIPLSTNSSLTPGDAVDINKARLLTLHRNGDKDINRVEI